jgi:transcriptional regulator with XRE-family HTH domain
LTPVIAPFAINSFVNSHLQLAHAQAQDETQTVEMPFGLGQSRVLKSVRVWHIQRQLLLANKNMEKFIGQQSTESDDPSGSVLRQLRTQQGLEAFVVASRACITIWQLYELETGKDSLFYTPSLRHKAAQRVATILGSDWDTILAGHVATKAISGTVARLHLLKPPAAPSLFEHSPKAPASGSPRFWCSTKPPMPHLCLMPLFFVLLTNRTAQRLGLDAVKSATLFADPEG